jgi:hypothetical protein
MSLAALLFLLVLSSLAPGFLVVGRLGWRPRETFCASIAASLALVYLGAFAIYVSGLSMSWCAAGSVAAAFITVLRAKALGKLLASRPVRPVAAGFLLLLAWTLGFQALVRHYGGGTWGDDWLEHFHRCLYFLDRLPLEVPLRGYHVTARPPFMNLLGAYFLAQTGEEFAAFQIVFTFLSTLPYVAAASLLGRLAPRGGRNALALAALFASSPFFIANATYTWTKLLSTFFVLTAIALYLGAWKRDDVRRHVAWPIALACGILVHYSAAPFAIFIAGHFLWTTARRRPGRLLAPIPGVLLLATWVLWACASFGVETTVTSNTAVGDARGLNAGQNALKIAANIVATIVPHPLRGVSLERLEQPSRAGYTRDYTFLMFQTNVLVGIGSIAGPAALRLLIRRGRRGTDATTTRFWRGLAGFAVLAGVATHGGAEPFGVAHVTLQPLVLLGVTLVAAGARSLSRPLRYALLLGCLVDFGFGVALHHELESLDAHAAGFGAEPVLRVGEDGRPFVRFRPVSGLSRAAWYNWYSKEERVLVEDAIRESRTRPEPPDPALVFALEMERRRLIWSDAAEWGGWYARHLGRVAFLGDRAAPIAPWIKVALVAGFGFTFAWLARAWLAPTP